MTSDQVIHLLFLALVTAGIAAALLIVMALIREGWRRIQGKDPWS